MKLNYNDVLKDYFINARRKSDFFAFKEKVCFFCHHTPLKNLEFSSPSLDDSKQIGT
jgi:hypothetical protein